MPYVSNEGYFIWAVLCTPIMLLMADFFEKEAGRQLRWAFLTMTTLGLLSGNLLRQDVKLERMLWSISGVLAGMLLVWIWKKLPYELRLIAGILFLLLFMNIIATGVQASLEETKTDTELIDTP